jgi:hypothetical protein
LFWWIVKFGLHNSQMKEKYLLVIYRALERIPLHESESAQSVGRWEINRYGITKRRCAC